ncbi:MAG: hypothetical protein SOZ32_07480 [Bacilli bacterium]|nr:hypothetical protein [Mollicutes bacterium]MDY3900024.1 hypothetical protein [Bacilli bacterium]
MSNKKNNKQKKQKTIVVKQTADGKDEVIITKAPSKTVLGKIVIAVLAFAMIIGVIASLVIVLVQASK